MKKKNIKINREKEKLEKKLLKSKTIYLFIFLSLILILLILRIGYIQFILGNEYKETAYRQQTLSQIISPKRGTIYDSTGKALAISANVDTITINPKYFIVKDSDPEVQTLKTKAKQELVATGLSEIFELNYDDVYKKVTSTSSVETIIKKVERDKVTELQEWMKNNKVNNGINVDEDTKRYYTYGSLASNLIGFCGTDNTG